MERKYFFFDIDGTLTDRSNHQVVPSALETLHQLEKNGHFVAIATGRAHYKAEKFTKANGFSNMVCNGGNGLVIHNEFVENIPLDTEGCREIIHQAEDLGYGWCIAVDDTKDVYMTDDLFLRQVGKRKEPTRYIIDDTLNVDEIDHFLKIYVAVPEKEEEKLTSKERIGHLRFEPEYLMFQPDNKRGGILKMMERLQGDIKDVVVFGDDYNDLDMFCPEWYSIAMGNGCQELKDAADYVTDTNLNDGIQKACRHFGWI
ncbi:MAG TPA: HAD family hydrolase [Candidatus Anaerostipes avistercoris]|uniref:HAD family hydrolase n=1 Tax=Candidatus Anaerostipes avistercoris TaxID=2838462 RepID=A0A9D2PLP9_9FIRM|nr:HAD family hydrolase [Candidatus Anaerostipes avistercoris]